MPMRTKTRIASHEVVDTVVILQSLASFILYTIYYGRAHVGIYADLVVIKKSMVCGLTQKALLNRVYLFPTIDLVVLNKPL